MKKNIVITIIVIVISAIIILNIIKTKEDKSDNNFNIATSFYPIYIATLNITEGANNVIVSNITKNATQCLHDYALSTEEMMSISDSDVLVINGAGMEGFLEKIIHNYPNLLVIDSSRDIDLIKQSNDGEEVNSHIFVSISNHIKQVDNISNLLAKYDTQNAELYKSNAEIYISKLNDQKVKMKEALKKVKNKNIITFHNDFEYFFKEFDLNVVEVIKGEHGEEPSSTSLINAISVIKENNVKAIFVSEEHSIKQAQTLSQETDAKVYMLDSIVSGPLDKNAYINIMEKNLQVLLEALN